MPLPKHSMLTVGDFATVVRQVHILREPYDSPLLCVWGDRGFF